MHNSFLQALKRPQETMSKIFANNVQKGKTATEIIRIFCFEQSKKYTKIMHKVLKYGKTN